MTANKFVLKHGKIEIDNTIGMTPVIYEKFWGLDSLSHLLPSPRRIELHGTAQTVIMPLDGPTTIHLKNGRIAL